MSEPKRRQPGLAISMEDLRGALADTSRCESCQAEPVFVVWEEQAGESFLDWDFHTAHDLDCPVWLAKVGHQADRTLRLIIGGES